MLASAPEDLPLTVRDAVLARVASLDPSARHLLDVVALVPARTELWLLEAVAGEQVEHLDACLEARVLREGGDGVAFRHELARLAIESAVPAARRHRLHAELMTALESRAVGDSFASRLAHHAERVGDGPAVLEYAQSAAHQAAAAGAHREAAQQFARALRFGGSLPAPERAERFDAYAMEAQLTGLASEAADAWAEAAALYRESGDRLAEGRSLE